VPPPGQLTQADEASDDLLPPNPPTPAPPPELPETSQADAHEPDGAEDEPPLAASDS
jgi:hypothetical protein